MDSLFDAARDIDIVLLEITQSLVGFFRYKVLEILTYFIYI